MSLPMARTNSGEACFPRVSGDEPILTGNIVAVAGFSPRERG